MLPMSPRQDIPCEIPACGRSANDPHHKVFRSAGGSNDASNIMYLCREHHEKVQRHEWELVFTEDMLYITDGQDILARRWQAKFDTPRHLNRLRVLEQWLPQACNEVRFLPDEALETAAEIARGLGKGSWLYMAELLYEGIQRMPEGTRVEKVQAVAQKLGLKRSYAYELMQLREALPDFSERSEIPLDKPSHLRVALRAPDPSAALELLQDRLAQNGNYSVRAFERETREEVKDSITTPPIWCSCVCPTCGATARHLKAIPPSKN